ncbi:MAG: 3-deoxy-D-manno-octulosonic acid transferase [Flavobacteriales bacterium]|nr:3-deoxy-D-manno-octulosonic acid transferase [Flavobacteriales bacterium]
MPLLTDTATGLYHLAVRLAAPFNPKARQWVDGRKGLWHRLEAKRQSLHGCLWMHCASVGEFEQGRPVLEAIKREHPDLPVLLTFFSPSGYEARKDFPLATHVEYLPPDSASNAKRLVQLLKPKAALWVKYEFWHHHLHALHNAGVPTFLISAIFRPDQPFFRWYGGAWRNMLGCFTQLFVQDERSKELLNSIGMTNVTVGGDTRFDRVLAIAKANEDLVPAEGFRDSDKAPVLVCGSTWPADEDLLLTALGNLNTKPRILIAPHELTTTHLQAVEAGFPKPLVLWSELEGSQGSGLPQGIRTALVDRMGLLARLYRYGDITYVGGGFGDGIHSLLEAAAWGKPVIFGPRHTKFAEARGLIDAGGGFEVRNAEELRAVLEKLLIDPAALAKASESAWRYVRDRGGATERIVGAIWGVL